MSVSSSKELLARVRFLVIFASSDLRSLKQERNNARWQRQAERTERLSANTNTGLSLLTSVSRLALKRLNPNEEGLFANIWSSSLDSTSQNIDLYIHLPIIELFWLSYSEENEFRSIICTDP